MKFGLVRKRQQQIAVKEEVQLSRKCAVLPKSTLRHRLNFPVKIREPRQDQTRVGKPDAPEQNAIQRFGHLRALCASFHFGGIEKPWCFPARAASLTASLMVEGAETVFPTSSALPQT